MSSRAGRSTRSSLGLALAGSLVALVASGCTLLGKSDWSCSDEATPGYEKLQGLVKTWAGTDAVQMELVGESCGQSDATRFIEITGPNEQLRNKLGEICPQDAPCRSDGLSFQATVVKDQESGEIVQVALQLLES